MTKMSLRDADCKSKRVLMRVDFNVPLTEDGKVANDKRIVAALPSIKHIIDQGGKLILMSHLGRPKGEPKPAFSLKPAAEKLGEHLGKEVKMAPDCIGPEVEAMVAAMNDGDVLLLENVRYHKEETDNDPGFAKKLSEFGDLYVNDAFGTAHRAHASTEGVTRYISPSVAGFLMEKELEYLVNALASPTRPFVAILGGAKVSDKITVIENLLDKVDALLIGGGMSYTFLKAQGREIGESLLEEDKVELAKSTLAKAAEKGVKFMLPKDHVLADAFAADANTKVVSAKEDIPSGWRGLDIGPETIKEYEDVINGSKTVVWNGPMGVFEMDAFAKGTMAIAETLAKADTVSIIGGGDSVSAVQKAGVSDSITHISTGGGASLELLEGKQLPGLIALTDK